jgi:DNA-directed RNA polymerase specialized sigma24 family protein
MVFAQALAWPEWALLGTVLVCTAVVVRRTFARIGTKPAGSSGQADEEDDHVETTAARRVGNLEVRLHDFAREVEARLETRAVELDALVAAADREIVRLTELVKNATPAKDPRRADITRPSVASTSDDELSAGQAQMVLHLHGAGFSTAEIAHMVGRPAEAVNAVLRAA